MPTNVETPDSEMTYGDFYIRQDHKFLHNIYSYSALAECEQIKTLANYYKLIKNLLIFAFVYKMFGQCETLMISVS